MDIFEDKAREQSFGLQKLTTKHSVTETFLCVPRDTRARSSRQYRVRSMLTKDWLSWVIQLGDGKTCDLLGPISDGGRVGEAECVILYESDARLAMLIAR